MRSKTFIRVLSEEDKKRYVEISFEIIDMLREREKLTPAECAFVLWNLLSSLKATEAIRAVTTQACKDQEEIHGTDSQVNSRDHPDQ